MNALRTAKTSGFTLVEMLTATAISATLASQAIPALKDFHTRQQLRAVSDAVSGELREARALAQTQGRTLTVRFPSKSAAQCFVVHTGKGDDCECNQSGVAVCTSDAVALKTFNLPASSGLNLATNRQSLTFAAHPGQSNMGSIEVKASNGDALKHVVSLTGRIRTCSSSGSMSGFKAC